jgi:CDP-2,3-bis-(O-geranylgeranyl)-sn-glycerol synthase
MNDFIIIVFQGFWLTLPAYMANPSAVLFKGKRPMDFGRKFKDGTRVLGDGKTWKGFLGGAFSGFLIGLIQIGIAYQFDENAWGFGKLPNAILIVILLSFGAVLGDVIGSFIKRRLGRSRGEKTLGLDQYDFLIGAWLLILIFQLPWFLDHFIMGWHILALITVIILTPLLHRGVNILGYRLGKKDVPW